MYTDINTYYIFICLIVEGLYNIPAGPAFCTGFPFTRGVKGVTGGKGGGLSYLSSCHMHGRLFSRGDAKGGPSLKRFGFTSWTRPGNSGIRASS